MGFLDKVKEQAAVAGAAAKEAAAKGQAKVEEAQAKRTADAQLRDLGLAVYAERTGRATESTGPEVERLMTALKAYEADHGSLVDTTAGQGSNGDDASGEAPASPAG
jgi:hypothetical protein